MLFCLWWIDGPLRKEAKEYISKINKLIGVKEPWRRYSLGSDEDTDSSYPN